MFGSLRVDFKLWLNVLGLAIFAALFALTMRRGVTDPVCGMKVDRAKALRLEHDGRTLFFCSQHCLCALEADPGRHLGGPPAPAEAKVAGAA